MEKDNTDSVKHLQERSAQMREQFEGEEDQQLQEEAQRELYRAEQRSKAIDAEEKKILGLTMLPQATRDQLLDRIRQMRNEKPPEIKYDYYTTPEQKAQLELEQKAGREAVARAEAAQEKYRQLQFKLEAEEQASKGTMVPVHHPNPSQQEQFPASGATLGPKKK